MIIGNFPILCMTVKGNMACGGVDYMYLHELCHAIDKGDKECGCGFDREMESEKNSYNTDKREYERLNETLTDIFCIEAMENLHSKNIYMMEPKEIVAVDVSDYNTHSIVKKMLLPFLSKYRKSIIKAKILDDKQELFDIIGEENFIELNDIVNKVDSLAADLENSQTEGPSAIEYQNQLKRLENVYANMENYKIKKVTSNNLLESAISATEEFTRMGEINDGYNSLITSQSKSISNESTKNEDVVNKSTLEQIGDEIN